LRFDLRSHTWSSLDCDFRPGGCLRATLKTGVSVLFATEAEEQLDSLQLFHAASESFSRQRMTFPDPPCRPVVVAVAPSASGDAVFALLASSSGDCALAKLDATTWTWSALCSDAVSMEPFCSNMWAHHPPSNSTGGINSRPLLVALPDGGALVTLRDCAHAWLWQPGSAAFRAVGGPNRGQACSAHFAAAALLREGSLLLLGGLCPRSGQSLAPAMHVPLAASPLVARGSQSSFDALLTDDPGGFADVRFRVSGGELIAAHRAILCSRSTYFLAMFSSSFKEAGCGEVPLPTVR
jgi:hypothetical protein